MTAPPLPRLIDYQGIMTELGVKRHTAERIMRHLPTVRVPGSRRVWVRRVDVARFLDEQTRAT